VSRQEERCRIAETTRENAVDDDVLRGMERVVDNKGEMTSLGGLAESGASDATG
jgi:hypothetical protein